MQQSRIISLFLVVAIATPMSMHAHTTSQIFSNTQSTINCSSIQKIITHPATHKIALIALVAWYFCVFKSIKGNPNRTHEWAWSNLWKKFGEANYFKEEIAGNPKKSEEVETSTTDENGITTTIKGKVTIIKEYGLLGKIDTMFLSKLKDIGEFLKGIKELSGFLKNPYSIL